jgi:two-component system OmpR family response regulator
MAKLLLIEDDRELTPIIETWLESEGHLLEIVHDGDEGLERLRISHYDLVILDWDLPGIDGMTLLRTLRSEKGWTPVLMLTGKTGISELCSRVRAMIRRAQHEPSTVLKVGDLVVDSSLHQVTKCGVEIRLGPRDFAVLEFLMRHAGHVFSAEALLERIWHSETEATVEAIKTCIKRLRQKLDEKDESSVIETIPRVGYRLRAN